MQPTPYGGLVILAATVLGSVLWFASVGVKGPTCPAPSPRSVEALFASCAMPVVASRDIEPLETIVPRPPRWPAEPAAPAVAGSSTDVDATGAVTGR